jgi:hypothetical protein
MTDEQIIFLISQPRSGSTLLQAILGGHPDIHTCSEPWIALPFIYARKREGSEFEFNSSWSKDAISAFFNESAIDEGFYNSTLNTFLSTLYQKALTRSGKKFFLDKTPRYYEIASDLINIFPDAKFIVLYRHPLSILNSILNTWVKDEIDILSYYSRDLLVAPQKLADFVSIHKKNICLASYESLVSSPEAEIKRICEYLGVDYLEEIIDYKSDMKWAYGDKKFKDKKAPDDKTIDAWKSQLGNKRQANFSYYYLRELGEEIVNSLGYDFNSALSYIKKFNPNENDYKTWKTLLPSTYVYSIEEQRLQVREKLHGNFLKKLCKKLMT